MEILRRFGHDYVEILCELLGILRGICGDLVEILVEI